MWRAACALVISCTACAKTQPTCEDVTCDPLATCDDTAGDPVCSCPAGYGGDGTSCSELDECADGTDTCDANASCTNTPGSFTCTCDAGYTGDGTTCTDLDECAASPCHPDATCTNIPGGYACACNPGFTGDGMTCVDIDECAAAPCDENATCTNTPGSFTCACNAGYTGDGEICADIDECASAPCDPNATCANTPGSFTCTCNMGWFGDGFTCTMIPPTETVTFPLASDTHVIMFPPYMWNTGDRIEGARTTSLPQATSAAISFTIPFNVLTCDTQDMRMTINGVQVGTFSISGGATSFATTFTFPSIAGPTFTLRYETTATVASGCGSASISDTGDGTVTLSY